MNFNDEIVKIEILNEEEMVDIEVSDDHLFYGDGILISNSIGIPAVSDLMFAIYRDEDMDNMSQFMVKQLKNRFRDKGYKLKFIIGCDREKQLLFDVSEDAQTLIKEDVQVDMDAIQSRYKSSANSRFVDKKKFAGFDYNTGEGYV